MRRLWALAALLLLAACGAAEEVGAPAADLRRAAYVHDAAPSLALVTVVRNAREGGGAHSALIVDGSQRVVFDPAGTFNTTRAMIERGDVLYGLTPAYRRAYIDFHTRETHHTIEQIVPVSHETAEAALRLVRAHGAVPKARCAQATSAVLGQLPGFEGVPRTWYPLRVSEAVAEIPGVRTRVHRDDDPADNRDLRARAP